LLSLTPAALTLNQRNLKKDDNRMSALAQSPSLFSVPRRRINEEEAIFTISHAALTAVDALSGLETIANVTLRLTGIHEVQIRLHANHEQAELLEWRHSTVSSPRGSATGLMAANSRDWGKLRLRFEPYIGSVECPLRFVRVVAQQAGLMLNRLELLGRNQMASAAVQRLQERLDTRKALSRAAGILAETKQLHYEQAVLLLLKQVRKERRSPLQLANDIINGGETRRFTPVVTGRNLSFLSGSFSSD
jgi:hypothetical protein